MDLEEISEIKSELWSRVNADLQPHSYFESREKSTKKLLFSSVRGMKKSLFTGLVGMGVCAEHDDVHKVKIYIKNNITPEAIINRFKQLLPSEKRIAELLDFTRVGRIVAANRRRPCAIGDSIGHVLCRAGTFGCIVKKDEENYILSNNHVLANHNKINEEKKVVQPGTLNRGKFDINDLVADVVDYVPIKFQQRYSQTTSRLDTNMNRVDAAIARPLNANDIDLSNYFPNLNKPLNGIRKRVQPGMRVHKIGAFSGYSVGVVSEVDVKLVTVNYSNNKTASFEHQIAIAGINNGNFAILGDSGSIVAYEEKDGTIKAIGLLFAIDELSGLAFVNPINEVLTSLNVALA